jgi:hypothetical protein
MTIPIHEWTEPLPLAGQRADPSGVQGAGTTLQALLLPGNVNGYLKCPLLILIHRRTVPTAYSARARPKVDEVYRFSSQVRGRDCAFECAQL